jgi:predicted nucleic acid-binding protein
MPEVLADTLVWSVALQHPLKGEPSPIVQELEDLIREMRVCMIGPIRQEMLSGIKEQKQSETLRTRLSAFLDLTLCQADFERAPELFNICRKAGVQGSNIDFLICAVAEHNDLSIFTTDHDFHRYQKYGKFILPELRKENQ